VVLDLHLHFVGRGTAGSKYWALYFIGHLQLFCGGKVSRRCFYCPKAKAPLWLEGKNNSLNAHMVLKEKDQFIAGRGKEVITSPIEGCFHVGNVLRHVAEDHPPIERNRGVCDGPHTQYLDPNRITSPIEAFFHVGNVLKHVAEDHSPVERNRGVCGGPHTQYLDPN
jgi:hypothetical protein